MSTTAIILESNPIQKDYEDYICAFFQSGGLYVEKSIILRETEEILELDIILTDFDEGEITKKLVEIKSGGWGFNEIFKVKGWLVYLKLEDGIFIVKKECEHFDYFKKKANELGIELVNNSDLSQTKEILQPYLRNNFDNKEIETLRFSYLLERKLLKRIKNLKKEFPNIQGYKNLDDYFFKINSGSFFSRNPVQRINKLFDNYIKYKNITAKLCYESEYGVYNDDIEELSHKGYNSLFYKAEDSPLQIALYIEHIARITIFKSCIEHLLKHHEGDVAEDIIEKLDYLTLPQTIKNGLTDIIKEPYFHRYPIFWQFFTYIMGGFILTDLRKEEYKYISDNTGIPIEEIPNALDSFNKLFPKEGGWMFKIQNSNIEWHMFFPVALCGVGANHRRSLHLSGFQENQQTYEELKKLLRGSRTMDDLNKWNNLTYYILKNT
jgi:hypothetical protein